MTKQQAVAYALLALHHLGFGTTALVQMDREMDLMMNHLNEAEAEREAARLLLLDSDT
ncbi:hypothetical protein [Alicyclobacillus sp. SO9]|uniref:hypothetical protein n=1 Tax=Alicyclobacillus sp. SO9 TaxID=2665646 RepID=UPI0018E7B9D4|nr:hypothetical protein [Alicyclobacillus sp. SO9]QQE80183.1 hypothetical protein GI364_07055 [Alicyclobacillus sp. SO9]